MDEEDDITTYLPKWKEQPMPFQSDDPVAPAMRHEVADDVNLDAYADTDTGGEGGLATDTDNMQADPISGLGGESSGSGSTVNCILTDTDDGIRYYAAVQGAIISPV